MATEKPTGSLLASRITVSSDRRMGANYMQYVPTMPMPNATIVMVFPHIKQESPSKDFHMSSVVGQQLGRISLTLPVPVPVHFFCACSRLSRLLDLPLLAGRLDL